MPSSLVSSMIEMSRAAGLAGGAGRLRIGEGDGVRVGEGEKRRTGEEEEARRVGLVLRGDE